MNKGLASYAPLNDTNRNWERALLKAVKFSVTVEDIINYSLSMYYEQPVQIKLQDIPIIEPGLETLPPESSGPFILPNEIWRQEKTSDIGDEQVYIQGSTNDSSYILTLVPIVMYNENKDYICHLIGVNYTPIG